MSEGLLFVNYYFYLFLPGAEELTAEELIW